MTTNWIAKTIYWVGVLTVILFVIAGFSIGNNSYGFIWMVAIYYWAIGIIIGVLIIGLAEIIRLLHSIDFHIKQKEEKGNEPVLEPKSNE